MNRINIAKTWIKEKCSQAIALAKQNKHKTMASLIVLSMGVTGTALASHYYNSNSSTLYHVFLDGKEIGTVDNPDLINQYVDKQIAKEKGKHSNLKIHLGNKLEFKEESKFKGEAQDDQTLSAFADQLQLKAAAQALIIDGKPVAYATDAATLDSVLRQEKEKYGPLPVDTDKKQVIFKEKVTTEEAEASPDQILTAKQLKTLIEKGTLEQKVYQVQEGDTIEKIAKQFNIKKNDIFQLNPGVTENSLLKLNQKLIVTAPKKLITVESIEIKQVNEPIDFATKYQANNDMYRGDSQTVQEGKQGLKKSTYKIVEENGERKEKTQVAEEIITQPVDKVVKKGTKIKPSRGDGAFAWPTFGGSITSTFGPRWGTFHKGIDIAGVSNLDIKASDTGQVVFAGWDTGGYGNCVRIDHGNGYVTVYGHLSSIKSTVGQIIQKGEILGVMGATGDATGVHLHFEIQRAGEPVNPLQFVSR
jgi:murein DD-endopeptidase MepM/ murein hydrolase activator NlpD